MMWGTIAPKAVFSSLTLKFPDCIAILPTYYHFIGVNLGQHCPSRLPAAAIYVNFIISKNERNFRVAGKVFWKFLKRSFLTGSKIYGGDVLGWSPFWLKLAGVSRLHPKPTKMTLF